MNNCDLFSILSLKYQRWIKFSTSAHDKQLIAYRKGDKSAETEGGGGGGVVGVPGGVLYMSQIFNRSNKYPAWWGGGSPSTQPPPISQRNFQPAMSLYFPTELPAMLCLYISQRNSQPCYVSVFPNETTSHAMSLYFPTELPARVGHPFFSKEHSVLCVLLHSL